MNRGDRTSSGPSSPPEVALDTPVDTDSLYTLRASIAAHASALGMSDSRVSLLLVVATELATNAIRHGGGTGRLRLWQEAGAIHCEVTDTGPGITEPEQSGTTFVPLNADVGRGLWIVRRLADRLEIANTTRGARVMAVMKLS
jgi:anti-sigma regulatory factor (Ser/Thr protein kinase)